MSIKLNYQSISHINIKHINQQNIFIPAEQIQDQYYPIINIQMLGIELTEKQKKIWNEMGDELLSTPEIKHLALQYYLQYRQSLQKNKLASDDAQKINNLVHIAYFISEKNQVTYNLRGERVVGITFSINQIIKRNSNFQEFIYHMKEMLKVITIEDKFIQQQIESCLKKFKFTMTFHHKFASTFKKIKPSPCQLSQSLLWLIFILAKQNTNTQNQNDIIEITCLIASAFIYFVEENIKNTGKDYQLDDCNYGGVLKSGSVQHVFLQYFRLKDMAKFQQIQSLFRKYMLQLKEITGYQVFFHQRIIQASYKKLDSIYMKKLTEASIDQRHFLKQRINTIQNANRFTPFGGRKHVAKINNGHNPNQILSHRVLNYDKEQQDRAKLMDTQNEQTAKKNASFLLKKLAQNKTPTSKTPLIKATPMTNTMQMYNWVLQKSSYHKFDPTELFRLISFKIEERVLKLINGLWKDIILNQTDKGAQLNDCQKMAILALSAQVVFFVTNSTDTIEKVVNQLKITWFDVWVKIDCFLNYDIRMPMSIKIHLLGIDTYLISKQLWKNQQTYLSIFKDLKCRTQKNELDRLYRRVIHEIAYQTYFLSKKLGQGQQLMNSIFLLCQYALTEFTELLVHRSLYHIILCSAYAVSKTQDLDVSFYSMLVGFKELNNIEKQDYHELTEEIYSDEQRQTKDIITFYNQDFVKKTKPMLVQLKNQSSIAISSISSRKNIISSPVKQLLPKNIQILGDRTNRTPNSAQIQTPMTIALQAYHESPLLKERRIKNLANYIDGKRIMEKKGEYTNKQDSLKQTAMLINQKWRNAKSPESKLQTTIKKGNQNI